MEHQANFREPALEKGNQFGQDLDLGGWDNSDDQFRGSSLLCASGTLYRAFQPGKDLPGLDEEDPPTFGERHVALTAIEERDTDLGLQMLDLLAERGLRGVEPLGGASEVQLFGDSHEVTQMA